MKHVLIKSYLIPIVTCHVVAAFLQIGDGWYKCHTSAPAWSHDNITSFLYILACCIELKPTGTTL